MKNDDVISFHERTLQYVRRWGIVRTIREQSVAEHSYYVALIADRIARKLGIQDPERLYRLGRIALLHDRIEVATGDIPGTVKMTDPSLAIGVKRYENDMKKELKFQEEDETDDEVLRHIIKFADSMEALLFLEEEQALGNTMVADIKSQLVDRMLLAEVTLYESYGISAAKGMTSRILVMIDTSPKKFAYKDLEVL